MMEDGDGVAGVCKGWGRQGGSGRGGEGQQGQGGRWLNGWAGGRHSVILISPRDKRKLSPTPTAAGRIATHPARIPSDTPWPTQRCTNGIRGVARSVRVQIWGRGKGVSSLPRPVAKRPIHGIHGPAHSPFTAHSWRVHSPSKAH
eukprot:scaffold7635_cov146-Isochrysis_galbana.AAC.1